jgi:hypothetical protein
MENSSARLIKSIKIVVSTAVPFQLSPSLEISEGEILNIQRTTVAVSIATLRL